MIGRLSMLAWPRGRAPLTILFYHRVLARRDPLRPGEIDARAFDKHMALVRSCFKALPLSEAVEMLVAGRLPERAACVTFDDGYADNFSQALPILERNRVPATVFVATAYLDGGRMFNDTLIEVVARTPGPELDLAEFGFGRHRTGSLEERRATIDRLLETAKRVEATERDSKIERLVATLANNSLPTDLMMTTEQVRALSRRGVEIGAHTHSHAILTTLPIERVSEEILEGRRRLEDIVARPVGLFAYPNGVPGRDYRSEHVALIRSLGFKAAVSTRRAAAVVGDDVHQLPRFQPWTRSAFKLGFHLARNAAIVDAN